MPNSGGYDAAGHVISATMGNGATLASAYNNRETVKSLGYANSTQSLWSKQYTWYPNLNLQLITDAISGVQREFTYDNLNRLATAQDLAGTSGATGETTATAEETQQNTLTTATQIWGSATATITGNATTAPDGSNTATTIAVTAGTTDNFSQAGVANAAQYDGAYFTGSIWLRVPSGTLATTMYIVQIGNGVWSVAGQSAVALTTTWQRFTFSATLSNGLSAVSLQLGGGHTITGGQVIDVWGAELGPATNMLQNPQQIGGYGWDAQAATITGNTATAPDGTQTAGTVTASAGTTDSWIQNFVANPASYSNASVSGSVWLRVASGTLPTSIYIVQLGSQGPTLAGQTAVTLTTAWQKVPIVATLQSGLTGLVLQVGGGHTIAGGQAYQIWGAQLSSDQGEVVTNVLPSSQQVTGSSWVLQSATVTGTGVAAPDGTSTAQTLTANTGSSSSYLLDYIQNPGQYSSTTMTASVYLRVPAGTANLNLYIINYGATGYSVQAGEAVTLTTAWQRFDLTVTNQAALTNAYFQIGGGGSFPAGQSISVWGAQMVLGANGDQYVETNNTTTVTGASQTLAANGLNQSYTYDAFGNLSETGNYNFVQTYTAANQLSGWIYDAAGNLLTDGLGSNYVYDGEGKIVSGAGASYVYSAAGQRVEKSGPALVDTVYFGGQPIARYAGGLWTDLIYGPAGLLAEVPETSSTVSGAPVYRMTDHLGSMVGTLSSTGAVLSTQDVAPFGEIFAGASTDSFLFTGKERDSESGNDYFGARYYGNSMGRFLSPDYNKTGDDPEPVPYADFEDPQSLNLYAYVRNNPLSRRDSTGHDCDPDTVSTNKNGDTVVTAGACHYDWSTLMAGVVGIGHHYIPQQVFQNFDRAGNAYRFLNKVTTGALKNPKLSNSYDKLHRALNRQTDKVLRDLERDLGKSAEDFEKGDWEKLGQRLEMAGEDVQAFNERLANLEPEARSFGEAFADALAEIYPAAAEAGAATGEAAGAAAEAGVIPY